MRIILIFVLLKPGYYMNRNFRFFPFSTKHSKIVSFFFFFYMYNYNSKQEIFAVKRKKYAHRSVITKIYPGTGTFKNDKYTYVIHKQSLNTNINKTTSLLFILKH